MERKTPLRTNQVKRRREGTEEEIKRKGRWKRKLTIRKGEEPGVFETGRIKKLWTG
jgi:hypothetical protein